MGYCCNRLYKQVIDQTHDACLMLVLIIDYVYLPTYIVLAVMVRARVKCIIIDP